MSHSGSRVHALRKPLTEEVLQSRTRQARDLIQRHKLFQPQVGVVLGSGLGGLANLVDHATCVPYPLIPHFPQTHAEGHLGQLVLGYLSGVPVALLQGRSHRYEGFEDAELRFPIRCLHALGVELLITTNAAGGLNPRFRAGELMVIDSHINFLAARFDKRPATQMLTNGQPSRGSVPYHPGWIERCHAIARQQDCRLHQGCYLATLGPNYETRSEYRMFRRIGADAVGMSTVPEVAEASRWDMSVLAFSVITNVASTDIPQSTTHAEVVHTGQDAGPRLMGIVRGVLEQLAGCPD